MDNQETPELHGLWVGIVPGNWHNTHVAQASISHLGPEPTDTVETLAQLLMALGPYLRVIGTDDQARMDLHLRLIELGGIDAREKLVLEEILDGLG